MSGGVKSQGTHLFLINLLASQPGIIKMACPTGIQGLGGARDQIESTCLDNEDDRTYEAGLGNPGQVSVPFILLPEEASHQALFDLKDSGIVLPWTVGLSDGKQAPTLDSNQEFVLPGGRSFLSFQAYVADVDIQIATNTLVQGTLTLQRSGKVNPSWKGA